MKTVFKFFLIFILTSGSVESQNLFQVDQKLWKPQKDEVYLQEVSTKIPTEYPITSLAVAGKNAFILSGNKLYSLKNGQLYGENSPSEIIKLTAENGEIWAMTEGGIYRYQNDAWKKIDSRKYVDLCMHAGKLHAATSEDIYRLEENRFVNTKPEQGYYTSNMTMLMEDGTQLIADPIRLGPIEKIESYSGTLYVLRHGQLVLFDGLMVNEDFID